MQFHQFLSRLKRNAEKRYYTHRGPASQSILDCWLLDIRRSIHQDLFHNPPAKFCAAAGRRPNLIDLE